MRFLDSGGKASESGGNPQSSDEGDSEDEGGLIPDIIQDDNILADDDDESSDDDVVDKTVEEMQQVLVNVPAMLKMPGVKLKLNSYSNFKVSRTALLSNKLLLVGRRLLRYFPSVMKLIPKSWWQKEAEQVAFAV